MSDEAFSPEGGDASADAPEVGLDQALSEAASESGSKVETPAEQPSEGTETDASESTETPDASASPTFTVKVDGQEHEVTAEELVAGYQRQADYTRKAQDVAAKRQQLQHAEALWQALRDNPKQTVEALYQRQAHLWEDPEKVDPVQQQLRQHDAFIAEQQDRELQREIDAELQNLRTQVGDFDQDELFLYAVDNQIQNLRVAYNDMQAEKAKVAERTRKDAERIEAKRRQAGQVSAGASRAAGSQSRSEPKVESVDDAWEAALAELNG